MPQPANLVHETSTTTGTGNLTLVNVNGKNNFNDAFGTGGTDVFDYFISNQSAAEWERGTGHIDAGTGALVRDTVIESTNSNNAVNFSAGTKDVTNDVPAGNQAQRYIEPNTQTGTTYTLALTDAGGIVTMSNGSANTLTIPTNASVAFAVGTIINVIMLGAGTTSITGDTGVTVNGVSAGSGDIQNQYQGVSLLKTATNTWVVSGDIGTVS